MIARFLSLWTFWRIIADIERRSILSRLIINYEAFYLVYFYLNAKSIYDLTIKNQI